MINQTTSYITSNHNLARLESILEKGICNSQALQDNGQDYQAGFDDGANSVVYVNCVGTPKKLEKALFDPYDGIYSISLESKNDKIENLNKDQLLPLLSDRAHQVAVLILRDISLDEVDKKALRTGDGFYFFERNHIEPEKIVAVLMSEQVNNSPQLENIKRLNPHLFFEFVNSSEQKNVPYSYKTNLYGGYRIVRLQVAIEAPDYLSKLTEIFNEHFAPYDKNMFIHVVRLWSH